MAAGPILGQQVLFSALLRGENGASVWAIRCRRLGGFDSDLSERHGAIADQ